MGDFKLEDTVFWYHVGLPGIGIYNPNYDIGIEDILEWLHTNVGVQNKDWYYAVTDNYIGFRQESDLVAFKLRFRL